MKKVGKKIIFENIREFKNFVGKIINEINNENDEKIKFSVKVKSTLKTNINEFIKEEEEDFEENREYYEERGMDSFSICEKTKIDFMNDESPNKSYCLYLFAEYFRDIIIDGDETAEEVFNTLKEYYINNEGDKFIDYYNENYEMIFDYVFYSNLDCDSFIYLLYCLNYGNLKTFDENY